MIWNRALSSVAVSIAIISILAFISGCRSSESPSTSNVPVHSVVQRSERHSTSPEPVHPVVQNNETMHEIYAGLDRTYSMQALQEEVRNALLSISNLTPPDQMITMLSFANETSPDLLPVLYRNTCGEGQLVHTYDELPPISSANRGTRYSTILRAFEKRAKEGVRHFVLLSDGGVDYEDYTECQKLAQNLTRYEGLRLWILPVTSTQLNVLEFNALKPLYENRQLIVTLRGANYETDYDQFMR